MNLVLRMLILKYFLSFQLTVLAQIRVEFYHTSESNSVIPHNCLRIVEMVNTYLTYSTKKKVQLLIVSMDQIRQGIEAPGNV